MDRLAHSESGIAGPHPRNIGILRLSALGDACQVVPLVKTLQAAWPTAQFTWIIGRIEARLLDLLPGVRFLVFDKREGFAGMRRLRAGLHEAGIAPFDVLLHLQLALRASLLAALIPARRTLGYDRSRAHELQWLFTDSRIQPQRRPHVLDGFFAFAEALGVRERASDWSVPLPDEAHRYAENLIPASQRTLLLSPCSSHPLRNWNVDGYAAVARHAARDLGWQVILCGGTSPAERHMAERILNAYGAGERPRDQIGKDTLPQMQALLTRASALLSPDSGPVHMATLADTPVIGLHAVTHPRRSGPYRSQQWCVNRFEDAALRYCGRPANALRWGMKIQRPGVMDLIRIEDVVGKLEALAASL
jgi:heptosyltransferase I